MNEGAVAAPSPSPRPEPALWLTVGAVTALQDAKRTQRHLMLEKSKARQAKADAKKKKKKKLAKEPMGGVPLAPPSKLKKKPYGKHGGMKGEL